MSVIKVKGSLCKKNAPAGLDDGKGCSFKEKWVRALQIIVCAVA